MIFKNEFGKKINLENYFANWDTDDFIQACLDEGCFHALAHHVNDSNEDLAGLKFDKNEAEDELKIIEDLYSLEIDENTNEHFYTRK